MHMKGRDRLNLCTVARRTTKRGPRCRRYGADSFAWEERTLCGWSKHVSQRRAFGRRSCQRIWGEVKWKKDANQRELRLIWSGCSLRRREISIVQNVVCRLPSCNSSLKKKNKHTNRGAKSKTIIFQWIKKLQ